MKNFFVSLVLFLIFTCALNFVLIPNMQQNFSLTQTEMKITNINSNYKTWYAQILDNDIFLYKTPVNTTKDNTFFIIEPSYFVKLIENANPIFYKAQYLDIIGYVRKNDVKVVTNTPQTPFLENINFRIFSQISQTMRSLPSSNQGNTTQVCYLPYFCKDAIYYGKIYGESAIEGRTNVWYFCKYTANKDFYGYIYSDGCDQMTKYSLNNEKCTYVDYPNFEETIEQNNLSVLTENSPKYTFVIILVSIPVAIFVFMIIRSNFILKHSKKEKSKEIKMFLDS